VDSRSQRSRLLAWALLLGLTSSSPLHAQDDPPESWEFTAALNTYWYPDEDVSLLPVVTADWGGLHLEGRYNYEDERTGSLFGGWTVAWDWIVSGETTPMLGLVLGNTNGAAPGLELDVFWWRLELYTEMEYLLSFDDREADFFYSWTEATVSPTDWLRAGLVAQRIMVFDSEREIDRGFLVQGLLERYAATFHTFNPDDEFPYYVFTLEASF